MSFSPTQLEIDKLDDCWVITLLLDVRGACLRLRMRQRAEDSSLEENAFVAEIQFGPYAPFIPIGTFEMAVCDILYGSEPASSRFSSLPTLFAREFRWMLEQWAKLWDIVRFGPTDAQRYRSDRNSYERFDFETQIELGNVARH